MLRACSWRVRLLEGIDASAAIRYIVEELGNGPSQRGTERNVSIDSHVLTRVRAIVQVLMRALESHCVDAEYLKCPRPREATVVAATLRRFQFLQPPLSA